MKFICPICETGGSISEDVLEHPITKTTCQNCGALLLLDSDTGKIDAYKSAFKDSIQGIDIPGTEVTDPASTVLQMHPTDKDARDWTAIIVMAVVLLVIISAGIYFAFHQDIFQNSVQSVSRIVERLLHHG